MRRLAQLVHHRSLTASIASLPVSLLALGWLPEHSYRLRQLGAGYLVPATVFAVLGLLVLGLTLIILIRDNQSGYPSFRCSLATLLWALACVPVILLCMIVVGAFLR